MINKEYVLTKLAIFNPVKNEQGMYEASALLKKLPEMFAKREENIKSVGDSKLVADLLHDAKMKKENLMETVFNKVHANRAEAVKAVNADKLPFNKKIDLAKKLSAEDMNLAEVEKLNPNQYKAMMRYMG